MSLVCPEYTVFVFALLLLLTVIRTLGNRLFLTYQNKNMLVCKLCILHFLKTTVNEEDNELMQKCIQEQKENIMEQLLKRHHDGVSDVDII